MSKELAQNTENRAIQAILKKVTRSNLCLICDIKFVNEIAVRRHYLNVHHVGTFACKVFGCKQVERTNGDLRKHYCLWHWELMSRKFLLPENPLVAMHHSDQMDLDSAIDEDERMMNNDDNVNSPSPCMECTQILHTVLGIKLHLELHRNFATFIDTYEKMSNIESKEEWEKILNLTIEQGLARDNLAGPFSGIPKRRQSKVTWDLTNNKVYEVPRNDGDQYESPPPSPHVQAPPRPESPIYISSDEELLSRLNEAASSMEDERLVPKKMSLRLRNRKRAQSLLGIKKENANGRRHSSHQSRRS